MDETNGVVTALGTASGVLDAVLANPEPLGVAGLLVATMIGMSSRGGSKFVTVVEAIPMVSAIISAVGEIIVKVAAVLDVLYDKIKSVQKPPEDS